MGKNVFVYGLSGAGKDTVSNYLRDEYGFLKLRIANTIKSVICEAKNLTFDELEELKRVNPELRKLHNDVSQLIDNIAGVEQSSIHRLHQLIDGTSLEFQHFNEKNRMLDAQKCVCDVRTDLEVELLLDAGYFGFFLNRRADEFKQSAHFTEQSHFANGNVTKWESKYGHQMQIINNSGTGHNGELKKYMVDKFGHYHTDGDSETLLAIVDMIIAKENLLN